MLKHLKFIQIFNTKTINFNQIILSSKVLFIIYF